MIIIVLVYGKMLSLIIVLVYHFIIIANEFYLIFMILNYYLMRS